VRNPIYLAAAVAVIGQALLLSRPVLLVYTAGFLAFSAVWVRLMEEPLLAERFGADYEAYRKQVPEGIITGGPASKTAAPWPSGTAKQSPHPR
jgi:protein-S-isoprenylcysteine O-methyltransferase Ste14